MEEPGISSFSFQSDSFRKSIKIDWNTEMFVLIGFLLDFDLKSRLLGNCGFVFQDCISGCNSGKYDRIFQLS